MLIFFTYLPNIISQHQGEKMNFGLIQKGRDFFILNVKQAELNLRYCVLKHVFNSPKTPKSLQFVFDKKKVGAGLCICENVTHLTLFTGRFSDERRHDITIYM